MMRKRVLLAGLFHETHTFLAGETTLADFAIRRGPELLAAAGDGSPLAGALEVGSEFNWLWTPTIDLRASPSAIVADEVLELFWSAVESAIQNQPDEQPFDGVYLVLHGAMVSCSHPDVEGEILSRLRMQLGGDIPICGVLDLHGNITRKMADLSQGLVAYRQNPHADACDAARRGARLLERLMNGDERAVTLWEHPPIVWPPTGTGTAFQPMLGLEQIARQLEADRPDLLAVNVFAGFSFADIAETGVSFTATTVGDPTQAAADLRRLSAYAWQHRHEGNVLAEPIDDVLRRIAIQKQGPIVLAEPSDNIGGGAPGDGTALLRKLLEHRITNAAVAINDPIAVQTLAGHRPGDKLTLTFGGRENQLAGPPLTRAVELISHGAGLFQLEDPHSHLASMCGNQFDMGPCAVVKTDGVAILLTTHKTAPFDLGQWRSQGIIPEKLFVIGVKAAVAHRKVYDPIAVAHYTVETPGPCSSDLKTLPYVNLQRPIFPLDPISQPGE